MKLDDSRRALAEQWLRFAKREAGKFAAKYPWLADDIHAEFRLALVLAAETWDESKGAFGTWAGWQFRGARTRILLSMKPSGFKNPGKGRGPATERLDLDVADKYPSREPDPAASIADGPPDWDELVAPAAPSQRRALVAFYRAGLTTTEIAAAEGITHQGVSSRIRCGLGMIARDAGREPPAARLSRS